MTASGRGRGQPHDRTALILYGSETGNSQDVAEGLGRVAERLRFVTRVSEMDAVEIVCPLRNLLAIMPCKSRCLSSYATGSAPKILRRHFRSLNNGPGRIPPRCEKALEESFEEAAAACMPRSAVFHHFWSWR